MFIVGNSRENTRKQTMLPILSHQRAADDEVTAAGMRQQTDDTIKFHFLAT